MSFFWILLLIFAIVYTIGVLIFWFVFWGKKGSKVLAERIKTTYYFDLAKPKEFRSSKKSVLFLLIGDGIFLLCVILGIWEERNTPPLIVILSGFLMILIYFNIKYLTTRIIIDSTGVSRIDIFRKTKITWSEIKKLQFFSAFFFRFFLFPPFNIFADPFLLTHGSYCFLYGQKNKILIPSGIRERNILIKTIIKKADLRSAKTSYYPPYVEWVK